MKKLFILFALLGFVLSVSAQTIQDRGSYVRINYGDGVQKDIPKQNCITYTKDGSYKLYIKPLGDNTISLDPDDYSYASDTVMLDHVSSMLFGSNYQTFVYVAGTDNIDTMRAWHITTDTTFLYGINYDYSADSLTSWNYFYTE